MIQNLILNRDKILKEMEEDVISASAYLIGVEFNSVMAELLKDDKNYYELVVKLEKGID